jgi:hypothetical protein
MSPRRVTLSTRPYISVQVVPAGNGANAGLGGALNIAGRDGTPDVLHMDAVEGQTSERRSLVARRRKPLTGCGGTRCRGGNRRT